MAIRTVLESGYRGVGRLIARRHHLAGLFLGVKQTQSARKRTWGLNVCCQGWSGRTGDVAGESVVSHKPKLTPVSPVTNAAGSRPDQKNSRLPLPGPVWIRSAIQIVFYAGGFHVVYELLERHRARRFLPQRIDRALRAIDVRVGARKGIG